MPNPKRQFQEAKTNAERHFLGRGPIVGVGSIAQEKDTLVFLLTEDSKEFRLLIENWGNTVDVPVTFIVTGVNKS